MGFFDRYYYGKAGKRDYSEMDMPKNRFSLFFLVLKDHFFDLIKVNFLQLIFWIPFLVWTYMNFLVLQSIDVTIFLEAEDGAAQLTSIMSGYMITWLIGVIPCVAITGPSSAGAAYVMRNWARDQHAFLFSDFKDAFKSNWKQALPVSVITSLIPVLAYTAVIFYSGMTANNFAMILPMIVVLSATLMWALMLTLMYPMMVGYELKLSAIIKNALLMAGGRLPQVVFARLITFIPVAILLVGLYIGNGGMVLGVIIYYLLFGFALSRLVYASVANGIFDRYLNPHIEGAQVGLGLRPASEDDELLDDEDEEDEDDEEI